MSFDGLVPDQSLVVRSEISRQVVENVGLSALPAIS